MRIRIAVAVARDGSWNSCGWMDSKNAEGLVPDKQDAYLRASAVEGLPPNIGDEDYHVVWVEADVPLPPEPPVVEGTVTQ